ncbi:TetR/AcrR family transcriptional regulator [Blastococcus brunescens]|uniref:TetR/AcrR family transcriptional regulator n=1 Tax=Blastococcus brunescens TaxID=1564165 RepID=A0ABZ1BAA8_9ACTN|nr:TetR/AcrR family transcriptional regulator [Blastococcus sp. BMG 8361]WRL66888.1 TetR/AcrR family transcriptional regulator [Blastococcus sp. BMG 8361]
MPEVTSRRRVTSRAAGDRRYDTDHILGPWPSRKNARGESTRAKLLDAALQAFAARGFHGTSTRDLAEAAGMSAASVYVHYPTKEELLYQLSLSGHRDVQMVLEQAAARSEVPEEQLRAIAHDYTAWHARCHTMAQVVQYEMAALSPQHVEQIAQIRREMQHRVRDIIAAGAEAGRFHVEDASIAALAVLSLGIDVARWYREGGTWTPEYIAEHYRELALRLVGSA